MIFDNFTESGQIEFFSFGEYFEGSPRDTPLKTLLNLKDDNLTPFAKTLLETNQIPEDLQSLLKELTRGIKAFSEFQDILDVPLNISDTDIINRHHAYFESLVYLRESVLSWLNRNVLAALTLLRPSLELTIIHLYWSSKCELAKSYKQYYKWLKSRTSRLPFKNSLNYVIDNLPSKEYVDEKRLQELKEVITNIYETLCAYHHSPKIGESVTVKSGAFGGVSLEIFFYYLHIATILLRQVVYLFILSYPMSLFPVEKHKKWGFSGPVGIFFDNRNFARLEHFLGSRNVSSLKEQLKNVPRVQSLTEWFESFQDLKPEEIDADWTKLEEKTPGLKKENVKDIRQRLALAKSFDRSLGWACNYIPDAIKDDTLSDKTTEYLRRQLRDW